MMSLGEENLDVSSTTFLRPIALADAADLFAVVDANRAHLRQWLPWLDKNQNAADTESFIASVIEKRQAGSGAVWAVIELQAMCGVVGFNEIDSANRSAVIGYWLAEPHQGRGIMTESVARLVRHGFGDLNLNRISINAAVENHRSRAIPGRLGFREEGMERQAEWLYDHFVDHVIYGQLRSEWAALTSPAPNHQSVRTINE
jgi:ribosomal-protein-serine acetyltransferase